MSKRPAEEGGEESAKKQKVEGTESAPAAPATDAPAATPSTETADTSAVAPAATPATIAPADPPATAAPTPSLITSESFKALPASVQAIVDSNVAQGKISPTEIEDSIYDSMKDFQEATQQKILTSFFQTDLNTIRNKCGYLIGILKKYRANGEGMGGAAPAAAPAPAYNPYDPAQAYAMMYAQYGMQYPGYAPPAAAPAPVAPTGGHDYCVTDALKTLPQSVKNILNATFAKGEVQANEIEDSVWESMRDFDEYTQIQIVERFSQANMSTVRNKTGYFIGILKIFRQQGAARSRAPAQPAYGAYPGYAQPAYGAPAAYGMEAYAPQGIVTAGGGAFMRLTMSAQIKIQELYNSGRARPGEIEDGVFDSLKDFSEAEQLEMVESFCTTDLTTIRNKTAFFIGILKRFRQRKAGGGY